MRSVRGRLVIGVVVLLVATIAWVAITRQPADASNPYADPAVHGTITFYDASGRVVTHGSVDAKPFVWRAVGAQPAPAPYDGVGATATLYAFQPRRNAIAVQ